MRIFLLINIIVGFFYPGLQATAQGYTGKVRNDSAFIVLMQAAPASWEQFAAQWALAPDRLMAINENMVKASAGTTGEVWVPVLHILRNENCEECKPVTYQVGKSEGLYRIGKWFGNQSVAMLKSRNKLRSDALQPGQQLIVGYLLSTYAGSPVAAAVLPDTAVQVAVVPEVDSLAPDTKPVPKPAPPRKVLAYSGTGVFAAEFVPPAQGAVHKAGKVSSFKSESGWTDGRFYLLSSQIKAGTVVKISNPVSGQFVFAKVVGPLPDIRQNNGLMLRISSAAAAMLGFWEEDGAFELWWEY